MSPVAARRSPTSGERMLPSLSPFSPRIRPATHLYRACAATVRAHAEGVSKEKAVRTMWGTDPVTDLVLRGAVNPATTTTPGWASQIAGTAVDDSIMAISSLSAGAGLIARGMKVSMVGVATLRIPGRTLDASDAGKFVGEGMPVPVRKLRITAGPTLHPRKLMTITGYTREMAESSNLEAIARALVSEATALALDAALFSTNADDGITPGGILAGVTPITPTAGGGVNAMATDIKALVAALVGAGAGADVVFIASTVQATSLKMLAGPRFDFTVLPSNQIAAGTVIAVEAGSFVSAFGASPEFDTSSETTIHEEDTTPADIVSGGVAAVPVKSQFQTDSIVLRSILRCAWGMRAPHVAFLTGATW